MLTGGISLPSDPHLGPLLYVLHTYSCPISDITSGTKGGRERGDKLQAAVFPSAAQESSDLHAPKTIAPPFPPTLNRTARVPAPVLGTTMTAALRQIGPRVQGLGCHM